jgi:hypothetical protein
VKHIDSLSELGNIEDPPFSQYVYANLPDTGTHFVQGLPIRGVQPSLNEAQLKTSSTPGFCRKIPEIIQAGADELKRLHALII